MKIEDNFCSDSGGQSNPHHKSISHYLDRFQCELLMKQQLEKRLKDLKTEFESGQKVLAELEAKQANVQNTLLRIQGAIQVLEEELAKSAEEVSAVSANDLDRTNGAQPEKVEVVNHG